MSVFRDWTVLLVRSDGLETHSLDLRRGRVVAVLVGAASGLIGLGAAGGLYWATRAESETVSALQSEVEVLRGERAQVTELAGRLAQVEDRYRVLQAAVTRGRPEVAPAATLPVGRAVGLEARPETEQTRLAWPLAQRGFITRTFGSRAETVGEGHTGLDIAVPTGAYVRAIQGGRIEEAGEDSVYGKFVRIAHPDGLTSLYGHNSWLFAVSGDVVERQQVIALSGNTGRSTAPHLHLELSKNGSLLDPLTLVTNEGLRSATRANSEQR